MVTKAERQYAEDVAREFDRLEEEARQGLLAERRPAPLLAEQRRKPLLIGEAPSKNEATETPIEGRIGRRLAIFAGVSFDDFLTIFDRVNLLHERQDTAEHGFEFDYDAARIEAFRLYKTFQPGQVVVLLGRRVATAFGAFGEYFQPHRPRDNGAVIYVIPHPSGINRWWNDPQNCAKAEEFMQNLVKELRVQSSCS